VRHVGAPMMAKKRAFRRGRPVPLIVAAAIGYLLGNWHVTALRSTDSSASQTIALRFPSDWKSNETTAIAPSVAINAITRENVESAAGDSVTDDAQAMLLNPEPMVPEASTAAAAMPQPTLQVASAEDVGSAPAPNAAPPPLPAAAPSNSEIKRAPPAEAKPVAVAARRRADRPGFVLDEAQISSIKRRLNLTPDQERMWPAVEAALRNLAYTNARLTHRRGDDKSQLAAADPNSTEVQDLKSAAIPLLMSFNTEQKDEVRNLAHVMGLDQLASQF
jgi:hypothetical protein